MAGVDTSVSGYFGDVAALTRTNLRLELRSRDTVPSLLLFVVSTLVVFRFALPADASDLAATGLLWIAVLFTALLALTRAFVAERDQRVLDGLVLTPCDRSAIWLGKALSILTFLVVVEAIALPAFALFFAPIDAATVAAFALADIGIVVVGTLLAAMAAASRARELLLPLLFLPLVIPVIVGGVGASVEPDPGRYLAFLGLYDAIFAILGWASFEYVVSE
jgi:heme exporter protein B